MISVIQLSRRLALVATLAVAAPASAFQPSAPHEVASPLPFPVGEVLRYRVDVALGGNIGQGEMRVEGPVSERGVVTWRLVSEMKAKRGFVKATDRTTSWLDPVRFASTRFEKRERHPLSSSDEVVEIDAGTRTYRETSSDRRNEPPADPRTLGAENPLDELSFLYFLRTLPLDREGALNFNRHFDETRNPTMVSVGAEEVVDTPLGPFATRVVVMHVRDPRHYKGIGLIKLNIDTSACRLPVRIVSKMPIVGATTLTLVGRGTGAERAALDAECTR
jgi:hypothetical protein